VRVLACMAVSMHALPAVEIPARFRARIPCLHASRRPAPSAPHNLSFLRERGARGGDADVLCLRARGRSRASQSDMPGGRPCGSKKKQPAAAARAARWTRPATVGGATSAAQEPGRMRHAARGIALLPPSSHPARLRRSILACPPACDLLTVRSLSRMQVLRRVRSRRICRLRPSAWLVTRLNRGKRACVPRSAPFLAHLPFLPGELSLV
jgi:hypothetical protein